MSVTLITFPPAFAFSKDQLPVAFQCDEVLLPGAPSVHLLTLLSLPIPAGTTMVFAYGAKTVTMTAAPSPDDSGLQFSSTTTDAAVILDNILSNFELSNDFNIYLGMSPNEINIVAKKESLGFDIENRTTTYYKTLNTTAGRVVSLKPKYTILFRLYIENSANNGFERYYEHNIPVSYASNGKAALNIGDKLHDYISAEIRRNLPDIPTTGVMTCKKSCRRYYFEYGESYGSPLVVRKMNKSAVFTVIHGGLSTLGQATKSVQNLIQGLDATKDSFLRQGPLEVSTRADQPQYLYFFNTRAAVTATLNCRFYFTDGSVAVLPITSFTLDAYRKYGLNLRFDQIFVPDDYPTKKVQKYEVWLTGTAGAVISKSLFYILDDSFKQFYKYFLFWSSWGTFDSKMFYGKGSVEFDQVQYDAEIASPDPLQLMKGSSLVYDLSIQTKFSITTGFIASKSLLLLNRDFFLAALKYVVYNGQLLPIKVTSKTIPEIEDGNNLYAQKFDYQYLSDDNAYTEGDVYKAPVVVSPPVGQVYFGSMALRPSTALQIKALSSQSPEVYLFPLLTGLNKFFVVAVPPGKLIGNVYNQTSDENLTTEFIPFNMGVDALTYRIYVMEMAINYSISNTLIISLING